MSGIETCVGNFTDPLTGTVENRTWTTDWPNFDNVGESLVVCFLTVTLNGYTQTMMEVRGLSRAEDPGLSSGHQLLIAEQVLPTGRRIELHTTIHLVYPDVTCPYPPHRP